MEMEEIEEGQTFRCGFGRRTVGVYEQWEGFEESGGGLDGMGRGLSAPPGGRAGENGPTRARDHWPGKPDKANQAYSSLGSHIAVGFCCC